MAEAGIPVEAHLDRILALVTPPAPVAVPVADALGLVTAADVVAPLDLPRFDHAAMDGYAVRAADVSEPVSLPVAGVVAAGDARLPTLAPGTAWRIMTGAPVPAGADAVVPFEWTDRGADLVRIRRAVAGAQNIRVAGEDVLAGRVALLAGTELAPRHLAFLAAIGCGEVSVRPAARVAVVTTGEELAGAGADLGQARIPDSNRVALVAAARAAGAAVVSSVTVPDDPAALVAQLARVAEEADLVVTTGGISAGDHDVVKGALAERADFWFGSVAVKPGRPQGCGVLRSADARRVPVVCLPGTPAAAYASFRLFAEPAIRALGCRRPVVLRSRAVLGTSVTPAADRTLLLPAIHAAGGRVTQLAGHVGHSQRLLAAADVLLVVPPGDAPLAVGTEVAVLPLT